jgi:xanthine dehydrogenase accessory factor
MEIWQFIKEKLEASVSVMLLFVADSDGSSPGKPGFKMAVAGDNSFTGTIGGGIMEYKLVEMARQLMAENKKEILLKWQHHDKNQPADQSGMICSGSQLNVFMPLSLIDIQVVDQITAGTPVTIQLSQNGIALRETAPQEMSLRFLYESDLEWLYTEKINERPVIHIIGGGHVSLALSELMCFLGFYSKVYDDRPELNTILQNFFANEKILVSGYEELGTLVNDTVNDYAVVMTMGYRTDKIALLQLLKKEFYYLGMMGSITKVETLFNELKEEGIDEALLKKVFTPIGININSKTAQEIAVSIAAEIINEKNKI